MRKIIASLTEGPKYVVAENAARAPFFVVFDNDKYVKTIENPFVRGGGAGFAVAEMLKNEGADVFVTKKVGDNLEEMLKENGIQIELVD